MRSFNYLFLLTRVPGFSEGLAHQIKILSDDRCKVDIFTNIPDVKDIDKPGVWITDDEMWLKALEGERVIYLSEGNGEQGDSSVRNIFKYQKLSDIARQILEEVEDAEVAESSSGEVSYPWKLDDKEGCCMLSVMPGMAPYDATTLGIVISTGCAEKGKVLLVPGSDVSLYCDDMSESQEWDFSRLVMCSDDDVFESRLAEQKEVMAGVHIVRQALVSEDYMDYGEDEIKLFVDRLRNQDIYQYIIFEFGNYYPWIKEVLRSSDYVVGKRYTSAIERRVMDRFARQYSCMEMNREVEIDITDSMRHEAINIWNSRGDVGGRRKKGDSSKSSRQGVIKNLSGRAR